MTQATLPPLPNWPTKPDDVAAATRGLKRAIRNRIAASGRSVEDVFAVLEARVLKRVAEIEALRARRGAVWPEIDYQDIQAGTVPAELAKLVNDRGCVIIRGHFPREQALAWDEEVVKYVDANGFASKYRGAAHDHFKDLGSKFDGVYPIYWSPPQMQARQSDRMARAQSFLNRRWKYESEGQRWFDPDRLSIYPDRIRRRPPGTHSNGLAPHSDAGSIDMFMVESYQLAFRHLFDGSVERFDPWDAAYRTIGTQYPATTTCSAFRTFQGWTALSDMAHDQGLLHTVPIPEAMGYLMLRPMLADVPEEELCGVRFDQVFPATDRWHAPLVRSLSGIPDIRAGDSVWWHCDMIHGVAPVEDQKGWGNVMYIGASPWCPRNEAYASAVRSALATGSSPSDFPEEHYERDWSGRFRVEDLNPAGRRGLGL